MASQPEIEIVGAGPAGLACAIILAKAGRHVTVREWQGDVGHRFHDDFQGLENWSDPQDVLAELAEAGIAADFAHHGMREGVVFDSHAKPHSVAGARPLFYLLRRGGAAGTLDRALLDQARAAGADVRFNDRVKNTAGNMVLAGGPRRADIIAVGYVFDTAMADGAWLAFGADLAPKGYAYLLVSGGRGTVASCMFTGFRDQAKYLAATVAYFKRHVALQMQNPEDFGGFGNVRLTRTAMQGGNPVIGEHAGFQDALAGFGLRYAMRSGRLAAESLLDGTDYTKAWRKTLQPGLFAGVVNRFLFNQTGPRGLDYLLSKLGRVDTGRALGQTYGLSFPKRLLLPLARYRYRAPLTDRSCSHLNCDCVWCQHGAHDADAGKAPR